MASAEPWSSDELLLEEDELDEEDELLEEELEESLEEELEESLEDELLDDPLEEESVLDEEELGDELDELECPNGLSGVGMCDLLAPTAVPPARPRGNFPDRLLRNRTEC
jgi:hypothetical protein